MTSDGDGFPTIDSDDESSRPAANEPSTPDQNGTAQMPQTIPVPKMPRPESGQDLVAMVNSPLNFGAGATLLEADNFLARRLPPIVLRYHPWGFKVANHETNSFDLGLTTASLLYNPNEYFSLMTT